MEMRVPVTMGFDGIREPIGFMEIDEKVLPKNGEYVFALGGQVNGVEAGLQCSDVKVAEFKLMQVALVEDRNYFEYLNAREKAGCL